MEVVLLLAVVVVATLGLVVVWVVHIRPDEPSNIAILFAVEVLHAPQSVCAKDDAPENISSMSITLETSHLDMSLSNDVAYANM